MMNACKQRTRAGRFAQGSACDFSALRDVVARFIWLEGAKAEADAAIAAKQRAAVFIVDPFHVNYPNKEGSNLSAFNTNISQPSQIISYSSAHTSKDRGFNNLQVCRRSSKMQLVPSLHSTAGTITGNGTERQLRYDD
jgi:hypothetical protein